MKNEEPLARRSQKQVRNKSLSLEFGEKGDVSSYSLNKKRASYYAPDGVIDALRRKVEEHRKDASIWMQHYPFVAGYNCDRWWLDQTDVGRYIKTEDASIYGTDRNLGFFATDSARAVARTKKDALVDIIAMTMNPASDANIIPWEIPPRSPTVVFSVKVSAMPQTAAATVNASSAKYHLFKILTSSDRDAIYAAIRITRVL